MSGLSLSQVIQALEEEFEEAEESFLADRSLEADDENETAVSVPGEESTSTTAIETASHNLLGTSANVSIVERQEDLKESEEVEDFIRVTCACSVGPSKQPCSRQFDRAVIMSSRSDCQQMSRDQLDIAILAQLSATRTHKDCIPSTYRGNPGNFRPHTSFQFRSLKICQTMFLFLHGISRSRFVHLCQHFDADGLVERMHGNSKRLPFNTCTPLQLENLVQFMPPEQCKLLRSSVSQLPLDALPDEIKPSGLTLERQWYLYDKIRQFCSCNLAADLTCPKPLQASSSNKRTHTKLSSSAKRSAH